MVILQKLCNSSNYHSGRSQDIKYIVIHYTANNGDTALGNANYFANNTNLQASANYFVDENEIYQSVPDTDIAWHCGATSYIHAECRNSNSIGIEICSYKDSNGNYYFADAAVNRAIELAKEKMDEYGISIGCVIRHYDVTGKVCPAPFVNDESQWTAFRAKLVEGVIDMALETWQKEGGQAALTALAAKGLVSNPETWSTEDKLAESLPSYLFWMMMNRLAEYKG